MKKIPTNPSDSGHPCFARAELRRTRARMTPVQSSDSRQSENDASPSKEKKRAFGLIETFLKEKDKPVIVILGPTASGKTSFSLEVAKKFDGEIISADSRQVYREIDVSSAKITKEEMMGIPHHMIDIRNPDETLTTQEWKEMAEEKIKEIQAKNKVPIVCGGTMLYISALVNNYDFGGGNPDKDLQEELEKLSTEELTRKLKEADPEEAKKINPKNRRHLLRSLEITIRGEKKERRPSEFNFLMLGIHWEREILYERINGRAEEQFENGLVEETEKIREKYYSSPSSSPSDSRQARMTQPPFSDSGRARMTPTQYSDSGQVRMTNSLPSLTSFGYSEIVEMLDGKISKEEALEKNRQRNRNYAKRQMTWWKREKDINWLDGKNLFS